MTNEEIIAGPPGLSAPEASKTEEDKRRAELLKRKQERAEKAAKEAAKRDLEMLELEDRFSEELGERGKAFEIVETVEGPIVMRLGEGVLFKAFSASKVTDQDVHNFVFPCMVYPAQQRYLEIVAVRPEIAARCAHALMNLFGAKHKDDSGKF